MRGLVSVILSITLFTVWCAVLGGCGSIPRNPNAVPPDALEGGIEDWKSCAQLLHPEGSCGVSEIQAMFESPQNITQLLQNLKVAADRGLLLQPSFYDEATLGKFFNASKVTLTKPRAYLGKGTGAIEAHVSSDAFPKLNLKPASNCSTRKYRAPDGSISEGVSANGFLSVAVSSDPLITLEDVRSVFGRENEEFTGRGWDADWHVYTPFDEGALTYQPKHRADLEDSMVVTLFYFKLKKVPVIEDSDVVTSMQMRDSQSHTLEGR
jgi:hypothetical protein